jgi:hypothetical protein
MAPLRRERRGHQVARVSVGVGERGRDRGLHLVLDLRLECVQALVVQLAEVAQQPL